MKRLLILFLCSIVASCVAPMAVSAQQQQKNEAAEQYQKLSRFYRFLSGMYVDEVEMKPLVDKAIREMLSELDPHSYYLDADAVKADRESMGGSFSGIGIEFNVQRDTIVVVNTLLRGPAESVGVMPNDRIVEVDSVSVVGLKREEVPAKLRGEKGSVVNIGIVRRGHPDMLRFSITRDNIPINTVDAAFWADSDKKIAYIKVNRFGATTMSEFREAMAKMEGAESLILDLCGNGGGLLTQAVEMAGYFLPKGSLVVSTEGRAVPEEQYISQNEQEFDGRVVVLLNGTSASASEVVAGALQDWDRGVVVGRDSFGKGLVQRQIPLGDGSAVRITVARYHTPSGRVLQRPYENGHKSDYYEAHANRLRGQGADSLSTDTIAKPEYKTLISSRKVYGGGGIRPDFYVESDTTEISDYAVQIISQGVYSDFIMSYLDANREKLKSQYPAFEKFNEQFRLSDADMEALVAAATAKGVEYNAEEYAISKEYLRDQLTSVIAQRLYSISEGYRWLNPRRNLYYKRAVSLLDNWSKEVEPLFKPDKK